MKIELRLKPPTTADEARAIAGTLSRTSKMPGPSYSLPASACKVGSELRKVPGSTCASCYACRGRYGFPSVKNAMARRLEAIAHPFWTEAMVLLIQDSNCRYFRWHDSGDIQTLAHLLNIVRVAHELPKVEFWLPTREAGIVRSYLDVFGPFPKNLIVRVSAVMVDGPPQPGFSHTSTVVTEGATCPAPQQGGKCALCRQCWDKRVPNVAYGKH